MASPSHIFVVGSYRSGTSMLRNALNCSPEVAICGETQFFGPPKTIANMLNYIWKRPATVAVSQRSRPRPELAMPGRRDRWAEIGDIATDSGARRVVDHICEGRPAFWGTAADQIDRAEFARRLLASDRTERSLFELLMALYAGGKPILGEKSPHHIHYVPTLLEWFPQAKVIHTLRDLRAIFVSQRQKKSKQENVPRRHRLFRNSALSYEVYMGLNISIHWLRLAQLHHQYRQCYPNNYYVCRFEDLVTDPERHLRKLCTFLDIDFNQAMLQQSFQNSSLTERHQAQGFDALATARWRQHLHPLTNKWLIWWSKKQLTEFGYPL